MEQRWGMDKKEGSNNNDTDISSLIETVGNHIYFYSVINPDSIIQFNKTLQETTNKLKSSLFSQGIERPTINIHIKSPGGGIFSGIAGMENILRLRENVDIITYIEGAAASAATFLSLVGTKRIIYPYSYMLIHQLSSITFGKYDEIKDEMHNLDNLMKFIKDIYKRFTKVPEEELDEILKHDIYFNAEKSLKYGLVDEIYGG